MKSHKRRRILRRPEVIDITGRSSSSLDRDEKSGKFPARVKLGRNAIGWWEDEVFEYLESLDRGACAAPDAALKAREC